MTNLTEIPRVNDQGAVCLTLSSATAFGAMEQENARLRLALREMRHRSGNQWQQLLGLAELEETPHLPAAKEGGSMRLRAMMSAFVALNRTLDSDTFALSEGHNVLVRVTLGDLLTLLQTTVEQDALHFALEDALLSKKGVAALLLICAELVCNAIKYGRKTTRVTFGVRADRGFLEVHDDGPGFPTGFCVEEQERQGLKLVEMLCRFDLNGEMRCHNEVQGGVVTLTFPILSAPEEHSAVEIDEAFCALEGIVCFDTSK